MKTLTLEELVSGMKIRFVDLSFNEHRTSFVSTPISYYSARLSGKSLLVIAVDANAVGKQLAVYSKDPINGHSCDGRVPDGHGLYVLPEQLYTEESYLEHKQAFEKANTSQSEIDKMVEGF